MTPQRSSPAVPDLGTQLRATGPEPEDDAAVQMRARLRHKMFGRGPTPPPRVPEISSGPRSEPRMESPSVLLPLLSWIVPAVAVVALAGMSLWLHRTRGETISAPSSSPAATSPAAVRAPIAAPEPVPPRPDEGPGLLAAAVREDDLSTRSIRVSAALQASWADPAAPRRLDTTLELASRFSERGDPRRALGLLRAVLNDLELRSNAGPARARLLRGIAESYDALGRPSAALSARAEAERLAPDSQSR